MVDVEQQGEAFLVAGIGAGAGRWHRAGRGLGLLGVRLGLVRLLLRRLGLLMLLLVLLLLLLLLLLLMLLLLLHGLLLHGLLLLEVHLLHVLLLLLMLLLLHRGHALRRLRERGRAGRASRVDGLLSRLLLLWRGRLLLEVDGCLSLRGGPLGRLELLGRLRLAGLGRLRGNRRGSLGRRRWPLGRRHLAHATVARLVVMLLLLLLGLLGLLGLRLRLRLRHALLLHHLGGLLLRHAWRGLLHGETLHARSAGHHEVVWRKGLRVHGLRHDLAVGRVGELLLVGHWRLSAQAP